MQVVPKKEENIRGEISRSWLRGFSIHSARSRIYLNVLSVLQEQKLRFRKKQEHTLFKDLRGNKQFFVQRERQNDNCWKKSARIPPRSEFVELNSIEGWVRHWGDPTPKGNSEWEMKQHRYMPTYLKLVPPQQEQEQLPQF